MTWRDNLGTGGLIGAACAACCIPPLIASLGIVGALALTAGIIGGIAVATAVLFSGIGVLVARRHRTANACPPVQPPTFIDPPKRRNS